jgi:hypothetical protein
VFRCTGLAEDSPLIGRKERTEELIAYAKVHFGIAEDRARTRTPTS